MVREAQQKAGLHFHAARKIRQEWRGKAGHVPASTHTVRISQKFQPMSWLCRQEIARHGCHANAALHNLHIFPIFGAVEDQLRGRIMGFFTEMFARPRPQEHQRYRSALALLHSMSNADRADVGIKPADFPRIAREMSMR
ncbi:hypothetical protein [Mesorhizobium caraganae]|uniref:hypothetical protein n=1 Tax=Mesorhizobium caraganae TaxID=483206 RepID=UPI003ECC8AF9